MHLQIVSDSRYALIKPANFHGVTAGLRGRSFVGAAEIKEK